ncbi:ADP-ribosylglycohydrolase family protein [Nitrincola sp.]|uniref:ADP-ribosylglycohydrolase family protein n=1 Tax=Nitrincola sp. TaxID=1926584 RepID=UPI003A903A43
MGLKRAQGCLMGQLCGDSLGSLVEFQDAEMIAQRYPEGLRQLDNGGTWNTLAGQPTDDSEMALALARLLVQYNSYDKHLAYKAYLDWIDSHPFDSGMTIADGLKGVPNTDSQANGALMRISPLGIFASRATDSQIIEWASQDAALTHPHLICQQANALYTLAIARCIEQDLTPETVYTKIQNWAQILDVDPELMVAIEVAAVMPPADYLNQQGWVLLAFQNALWQLLHAESLEEAIVDTVMRGGDTDTNAAICGALLGAVYGVDAIPERWIKCVLNCRPAPGKPGVHQPRPEIYWPVDALELAERLLNAY